MGRAGSGGYATVQHAYDTRLKRDVAIKCIKISPSDIERSKMSIHDAQAINESIPIAMPKGRLFQGEDADEGKAARKPRPAVASAPEAAQGGFVPLTAKISEPSFLDKNEERRANRARRHGLLKERRETARFASPNAGRGAAAQWDPPSMDLSDFEGYSNFKVRGRANRRSPQAAQSFTLGFSEFAGNIPGKIAGAGEADIAGLDDAVNVSIKGASKNSGPTVAGVTRSAASDELDGADMQPQKASPQRRLQTPKAPARAAADQHQAIEEESFDLAKLDHIPGLEEARTAAHLNDANIVTIYDCVVEGDTAYVIMEYVEGKTLARIMRDLGDDITLDMVASVFASVSHALEVAHKAGVLHLDIKPENVIVNKDGVVKVTDFGLSALMDASGQGETGGGTIGYMPLEQMRQERLDVRTDEWALASLTYEMLSGKNPFKARNLRDAEAAIEGAELVIPSLCWEHIDEAVDDIMFDALSPHADGRYPDIESFSADLTPVLGSPKEGKAQLAAVVKGPDPLASKRGERAEREKKAAKPYVPFIDKLGMRGSSIVMRVFAALGTAMIAVISLMNFRFDFGQGTLSSPPSGTEGAADAAAQGVDTLFGLFSSFPILAWVLLAALVAFAVVRPRWSFPATAVAFVIMLLFNQAWVPGLLMLLGAGAWWWFFGRGSDMMCTLALTQPLFGSIGFSAVVPVLAGALLDVRDALAAAGMVALGAIMFASFGSDNVMDWNVMANFIVAVNPSIAGAQIANGFIETILSLQNLCVLASWIGAAAVFSLLCRHGTRTFDILGSILAALCIVAGILVVPLITGDFAALTPLAISGAAVAALIGVVFALLGVTDRVRMAPGEW